ncbi:MAG: hypothetical protein ACE5G8_08140 [Anaerolineae bacterium]
MNQNDSHLSNSPPSPGISGGYFALALLVTLVSFVAGLAVGFLGRPLVVKDTPVVQEKLVEVVVTATPGPAGDAQAQALSNAGDEPAPDEPPTIMDLVMSDARHIQGQPNAPITIVEFADFK